MHTPYIVPGENGGRTDVRWICVRQGGPEGQAGPGVLFATAPSRGPFAMASVSPYGEPSSPLHKPVYKICWLHVLIYCKFM